PKSSKNQLTMPSTWFSLTWWHFYPNGCLCGPCLNYCDIYGIQLNFLNRNPRFVKIDDTQDTNSQPVQNNDSQTPQQIVHNMNQHTHTQSNINHINSIKGQSPQKIVNDMNQHIQYTQSNINHINGINDQSSQQIVHNMNQHQHAQSNFNHIN
ncbi:36697_t:CDS:2, partial [Racocetra persica]